MITNDLIKSIFEDQFDAISPFFIYKDHQLLKENKFQEFIDHQLKRARIRFSLGIVLSIFGLILGITYGWFYMDSPEKSFLINSIYWIVMSLGTQFWFTKQFYIVKSSMLVIRKMLVSNEASAS